MPLRSMAGRLIPNRIKQGVKDRVVGLCRRWADPARHGRFAFSQEGEDLIVARLFGLNESARGGFYVDVGAHHPTRYSNTRYLYDRGWTGINIDAQPGAMEPFKIQRPRDINLEMAVGDAELESTFFEFNHPQHNGFNVPYTESADEGGLKLLRKTAIKTRPLSSILAEHVPARTHIDLLSVDVEGFDLKVLSSLDWSRHRPSLILVEDADAFSLTDCPGTPIGSLLTARGYVPVAKTALTVFFADPARLDRSPYGIRVR